MFSVRAFQKHHVIRILFWSVCPSIVDSVIDYKARNIRASKLQIIVLLLTPGRRMFHTCILEAEIAAPEQGYHRFEV